MERIIYRDENGGVAVIIPIVKAGVTVEQIAAKDVPSGKPYKIVDSSVIPADRAGRERWTVNIVDLTDGIGAGA